MTQSYASQRRKLLALQSETPPSEAVVPESGLIVPPRGELATAPGRQTALSVPESVRALGEPLDPFFTACGGRNTISVSVWRQEIDSPAETYIFQQPFVLIGRSPENDLPLPDPKVSFRHLYLQLVAGSWLFVDLGLISGASTSDKGKNTSGWFEPESELSVGPYTLKHLRSQSSELIRPATSTVSPSTRLPIVDLEFLNKKGTRRGGQTRRIVGPVTLVGASRQCDLWLRDDSVSKVHASLVLTPQGLWVVDLLGRDSVLVDGRPAYWKQIRDGSLLEIGRFRMRVLYDAARHPAARQPTDREQLQKVPVGKRRSSSGSGSLSEESVMGLLQHITEMQNQFFEHSQLQMQFMTEMLAHLGRTQRASVGQDLARIDEIGRELNEIKLQIDKSPAAQTDTDQPPPAPAEASSDFASAPCAPQRSAVPTTRRPTSPVLAPESATPPEAQTNAIDDAPVSAELNGEDDPGHGHSSPVTTPTAHTRLTQRMVKLAQERNSRWRRILSAFGRKSETHSDD